MAGVILAVLAALAVCLLMPVAAALIVRYLDERSVRRMPIVTEDEARERAAPDGRVWKLNDRGERE